MENHSSADTTLQRVEQLLGQPDETWSRRKPDGWRFTIGFLSLLLHWARTRTGLVGKANLGARPSLARVSAAEAFCVELALWRSDAPWDDEWPIVIDDAYVSLSHFERYQAMRILEHSRILEPTRELDASTASLAGQDDRGSWPVRSASRSSASRGIQRTGPARKLREQTESLIRMSTKGSVSIASSIDAVLSGWRSASDAASGSHLMLSLGHVRLVDAVLFATVLSANGNQVGTPQ